MEYCAFFHSRFLNYNYSAFGICCMDVKTLDVFCRLRGDVVLAPTDRIQIIAVDGKYSLVVKNIGFSDGGKYTVRASNDAGESRFTATVVVKGWSPLTARNSVSICLCMSVCFAVFVCLSIFCHRVDIPMGNSKKAR